MADGVRVQASGFRVARPLEPTRVIDVGREQNVEWGAVLNLGEEVARRPEGQRDFVSAVPLESRRDGRERGLQIRRGGDAERLRRGGRRSQPGGSGGGEKLKGNETNQSKQFSIIRFAEAIQADMA